MITVAAFYKFTLLPDKEAMALKLKELLGAEKILGTVILAYEGINGTVAGSALAIENLRAFFAADSRFAGIEYKESFTNENPFYRLKVKLKEEIVTLGKKEANPAQVSGTYVNAKEWNELLNDPETLVLDVRNDYEIELGTFKNAKNPQTASFREFPKYVSAYLDPQKHTKIAMSCTGGIRCEKASSLLKMQGFKEVYHLKGGILQYLADVEKEHSKWQGECFVFDNRVAVNHDLEPGAYDLCHGCRFPISPDDKKSEHFQKGVSCARCFNTRTEAQKNSANARQKQIELHKARGPRHLGAR
ncbi:MAG TPA: rhodanese-related sulfurtransferase [Myxococcota bacterium]|nr:rhodanese-related sulfurtransferase [Myxococcota bacterium]